MYSYLTDIHITFIDASRALSWYMLPIVLLNVSTTSLVMLYSCPSVCFLASQNAMTMLGSLQGVYLQPLLMAIAHQHLPYYGVQFHPESIATTFGTELMLNFQQLCEAHRATHAGSTRSLPARAGLSPHSEGQLYGRQMHMYHCSCSLGIAKQGI